MTEGPTPEPQRGTTADNPAHVSEEIGAAFNSNKELGVPQAQLATALERLVPDPETISAFRSTGEGNAQKLVAQTFEARDELIKAVRIENEQRIREKSAEADRTRFILTIASAAILLLMVFNLVSKFDDFLAAIQHAPALHGLNIFTTTAYAATTSAQPLSPAGQQKIIIIYVIYIIISVSILLSFGLMYSSDDKKQENGKDLAKILIGFVIGVYTGHHES